MPPGRPWPTRPRAEVAGNLEGTSEEELDEPLVTQAAGLCRLSGADEDLIPEWVAEGKRRAERVRTMPHSEAPRRSASHLGRGTRPGTAS